MFDDAGLSEAAKAKAVELGLDKNRSALLKAASRVTPEEQVEYLEWHKKNVRRGRKPKGQERDPLPLPAPTHYRLIDEPEPEPKPKRITKADDAVSDLKSAWLRASEAERHQFVDWVGRLFMSLYCEE